MHSLQNIKTVRVIIVGEMQKIYYSESSKAQPARPSGKAVKAGNKVGLKRGEVKWVHQRKGVENLS